VWAYASAGHERWGMVVVQDKLIFLNGGNVVYVINVIDVYDTQPRVPVWRK
jgi:hypothetical protein